jgi:carboxypeptidase T
VRPPLTAVALLCALSMGLAGRAPVAASGPMAVDGAFDFPNGDEALHTYAEMRADVAAVADAHPSIVRWFDLPTATEQGRRLMIAKVSDNVGSDENEPEVFLNGLTHAREHISAEQALAALHWLADGYGSDQRVRNIVDSREIWILFMVNPDGGEYDISGGSYHSWRKNRQPTPGSGYIGTDINRNYGYRWGCCGGSSSNPAAITYRGPYAFSTQEARAVRDFVLSRRVGGRQQIRTAISFHSYGEQILYPYGYTTQDIPFDMTVHDHQALVHMAQAMGSRNGYRPIQESQDYITSGAFIDWSYGSQRIHTFTFELYPRTAGEGGFYPSATAILAAVQVNRDAILWFLEQSDCPWRAAGSVYAREDCGPFFDDMETGRGWHVDPDGTDTATSGRWARGDAGGTDFGGPKQLAAAASGRGEFATGLKSGTSAWDHDLDGGQTTVESPPIHIPTGGANLSFRFTWAHDAAATTADYLRVRVVDGPSSTIVWHRHGTATNRNAVWSLATVDLSGFAGHTIELRFEAADGGADNLVEAALDEVRVTIP